MNKVEYSKCFNCKKTIYDIYLTYDRELDDIIRDTVYSDDDWYCGYCQIEDKL